MADIQITKTKLRRGLDSQRQLITPDQGELISTTDTKRVYLGTGDLVGGVVVGNKIHFPITNIVSLTSVKGEVGDLINANNAFYQLTSSDYTQLNSWKFVGPKISSNNFQYDATNAITLKLSSVNSNQINPDTVTNGLIISGEQLQINYNVEQFRLSSSKFSILESGINETHISKGSLSRGLSGGGGDKIYLNVDPTYFIFDGNTLSLSASPSESIVFNDLSASWFSSGLNYDLLNEKIYCNLTDVDYKTLVRTVTGEVSINPLLFGNGLYYNTTANKLSSRLVDVDNLTLRRSSDGTISIATSAYGIGLVYNTSSNILSTNLVSTDNISLTSNSSGIVSMPIIPNLSGSSAFTSLSVNEYGKVVSHKNGILDVFTGNSDLGEYNLNNTLSSIFNGDYYGLSGLNITKFTALSSDNTTILNLSSAGFIAFESGASTQSGKQLKRFAIPIFIY